MQRGRNGILLASGQMRRTPIKFLPIQKKFIYREVRFLAQKML